MEGGNVSEESANISKSNVTETGNGAPAPGGKQEPESGQTANETNYEEPHQGEISFTTCQRISYVTKFATITCAVAICSYAASTSINKMRSRHILQSYETVTVDMAWFKFAICLRPFLTSTALSQFYVDELNLGSFQNYTAKLRKKSNVVWNTARRLDIALRPDLFLYYFYHVHPWNKGPLSLLQKFQVETLMHVFESFSLNNQLLNRQNISSEYGVPKYVLYSKNNDNITMTNFDFKGEFLLSPFYLGCFNVTVNETMSERLMNILIKAKSFIDFGAKGREFLFEVADFFVYGANDDFTEIPIIQKYKKYTIDANLMERILVKGVRQLRQNIPQKPCENDTDYSQTNCRQWCITRQLFKAITCTLPWMVDLQRKPWIDEKYRMLPLCPDAESFSHTLKVQEEFLQSDRAKTLPPVKDCLEACPDNCLTTKIRVLTLGPNNLGLSHGMDLVVPPEVDSMTERFDYSSLNMIAELSASISFLLGLSAIAIYDWLVAFGAWATVRLGLSANGAGDRPAAGEEDQLLPQPSELPRLAVLPEEEEEDGGEVGLAESAAQASSLSFIWYVQPSGRNAVRRAPATGPTRSTLTVDAADGRRDSLQLPPAQLGPQGSLASLTASAASVAGGSRASLAVPGAALPSADRLPSSSRIAIAGTSIASSKAARPPDGKKSPQAEAAKTESESKTANA